MTMVDVLDAGRRATIVMPLFVPAGMNNDHNGTIPHSLSNCSASPKSD